MKKDFINPFYMENWKHTTFSHFEQFSQEFDIKLQEIGFQNVFNHVTSNILNVSATMIKVLQDWMNIMGLPTLCTYFPTSTLIPIPLILTAATRMKPTS